ncbi:unnamed protein product [Owenia fusiformis]|uniref:Ragulator complex protein LAMTOR1 n=1 Tax=Owenia fusiformis TaxID=6347 RepID=A0A8J1TIF2_OWEFU|nr:unnamed protein product [Owenia fusiformis]
MQIIDIDIDIDLQQCSQLLIRVASLLHNSQSNYCYNSYRNCRKSHDKIKFGDFFHKMGCCQSNEDDTDYKGEPSSTTRLLGDPVSNNTPGSAPSDSYGTYGRAQTVQPQVQHNDEQSALSRILNQTANNVIDVAAMDSHAIEQHEYMDRARQYGARVANICNNSQKLRHGPRLPNGIAAPHVVLAARPVSQQDIQLITNAAELASKTLPEVKVKHKEDLVVHFGVP